MKLSNVYSLVRVCFSLENSLFSLGSGDLFSSVLSSFFSSPPSFDLVSNLTATEKPIISERASVILSLYFVERMFFLKSLGVKNTASLSERDLRERSPNQMLKEVSGILSDSLKLSTRV